MPELGDEDSNKYNSTKKFHNTRSEKNAYWS